MQNTLRKLLLVAFFSWFSGNLFAWNPPPANDSVWGAENIGILPLPPVCPSGGNGNAVVINASTTWASYNTFDFSPAHCFPSGSPDVWYRFTATSSMITIDATGFNGLDTFFIKLYHSQGSCFSIIPLSCETSVLSAISANFLTPELGEEYYIQIGGNQWYKTGDFTMSIKSLNNCNECINESSIELSPVPWFGRYGISQTVDMCYTVERWDYIGSADLHSIVPRFGIDWDIATLTPVSPPASHSSNNAWHWFTNINTPDGPADGYFFDPDNDGNPSNNEGDSAGVLDSWEACWRITTLPYCNVYDLGVTVNAYCDVQTGTGISTFACTPSAPLDLGISGWCCASPAVAIAAPTGGCNGTSTVTITGVGNAGDVFNYTVYDTGYSVLGNSQNVITYTIGLPPGEYNVEAFNVNSSCIAYTTLIIPETVELELSQTQISCGSGFASLYAKAAGGNTPYTYNFVSHPLSLQTDSVAVQVPDGWMVVTVTDALGCSVTDSIFVTSLPASDAYFDYPNDLFCTNADSIVVLTTPATFGGTYNLLYPQAAGITVDPNTGTIDLNNTTFGTPFWLKVKYSVGASTCYAAFIDSVQIVGIPPAPVPVTPNSANYCIGGSVPSFTVSVPATMYALWYDVQTTASVIGTSFTPPLTSATNPGTYFYIVTTFFTVNGGCISTQTFFTVTAVASPSITASSDTLMCVGEKASLSASGCASCNFVWTPAPTISVSGANAQTSPPVSTNYTVTATDPGSGCIAMDFVTVNIDPAGDCSSPVVAYTGITPNGDGHNDAWVIDGIDSLHATVRIFSRWGKEVWSGSGYDNSTIVWRGLDSSGNALPDGTYYFVLDLGDFYKSGWIELSH
jgi:gliding motility-associated-like protein